jgi:hypothetical protein
MPPKKQPPPLRVSMHHIQEERRNLELRTKRRIAQLFPNENSEGEYETQNIEGEHETHVVKKEKQIEEWHCCRNIFCFCLTLLTTFYLVFLQWLYIQVPFKFKV